MTAAVIALAALGLLLGGGLVYAIRWGMRGWDEANTRGDLYRDATKQRDQMAVDIAQLKQQNAVIATRLTIAGQAAKRNAEATTKATVDKIKSAKTAKEAAGEINTAMNPHVIDKPAPLRLVDSKPIEELK